MKILFYFIAAVIRQYTVIQEIKIIDKTYVKIRPLQDVDVLAVLGRPRIRYIPCSDPSRPW